jgi:DNA segregation ATPase FtsK/SpoIIIE-like protein
LRFDKALKNLNKEEVSTVLIVGMTGVGKSTFINSMINQLLGVELEDDFRYILIEEPSKEKQLKSVTT